LSAADYPVAAKSPHRWPYAADPHPAFEASSLEVWR